MSALSVSGIFALALAGYSVYRDDKRVSVLCLWLAQTAIGGAFLAGGLEFLALTLWILSTLSALTLFFHALLLGEYAAPMAVSSSASGAVPKQLAAAALFGWALLVVYPFLETAEEISAPSPVAAEFDLRNWGRLLIEEHWVALIACAVLLGAVAMGAGLVARPERDAGGGDA